MWVCNVEMDYCSKFESNYCTSSKTAAKLKPKEKRIINSSIENFQPLLVGSVSVLKFSRSICRAATGNVLNKNP